MNMYMPDLGNMASNGDTPAQIGPLDVLILMQMATLKAVGAKSVSDFDLKQHLPAVEFDDLTTQLQKLANRMLIARTIESGQVRLSLTPLGAAVARELKGALLDRSAASSGASEERGLQV